MAYTEFSSRLYYKRRVVLTSAQKEEIRRRYLDGESGASLALEYGVSFSTLHGFLPTRRDCV